MERRTLLSLLGLPVAGALGALGWAAVARSRNPYYEGAVSDHFDGLRFFSPGEPPDRGLAGFLRWQLAGGRADWPEAFPSPFQDRPPGRVEGLRVALVGHATLLVQVAGLNLLTDPVFGERASPLSFAGPRRVNPPGIAFGNLPPIDAVLITHNHYDHLDVETVARLWRRDRPRLVAPLGNDTILKEAVPDIAVESLDWGGSVDLAARRERASASRRSTGRPAASTTAAWRSGAPIVLTTPAGAIYHVGDTGYGDGDIFRAAARALRRAAARASCRSAPTSRAGSCGRSTSTRPRR